MKTTLGQKLKTLRIGKAISLKQLAKKLRIDRAHLSRIEADKISPSEDLLYKLSKMFGCNYEELSVLSGRLPDDVRGIIADHPKEACDLLRNTFSYRPSGNGHTLAKDGPENYRVIDLFSGAGGMTLGFTETKRFMPVFANDFNDWSVKTYNANFGDHCVGGDINKLLENPDLKLPKADVVIGGPPCQGFSLLNKQREFDPRKQLWIAYMEVVRRVKPLVFVMENVSELLASAEFQAIREQADKLGYKVKADILNAADFGVAQRRRRAIIIGSRIGVPELPTPTYINPAKRQANGNFSLLPWKTVRGAIGDLPSPEGTEIRHDARPPLDIHFGRSPTAMSIARYKCVPEGGNRFDLQKKRPDLTPDCWKRKKSGGTDLFGRLWWDRPAFTIRTEFFKPEKGRYLHPSENRPITHREAARIQSFPDHFRFTGSKTEIAIQIGNAVAPTFAQRIAETVLQLLDNRPRKETKASVQEFVYRS